MASQLFVPGTVITSPWLNEVDTDTHSRLSSIVGTNAITATGPVSMTAYAVGQRFSFTPVANNTGATTININGLGVVSITKLGAIALITQDLLTGVVAEMEYDGTRFQLINPQTFNLTQVVPVTNGGTGATTANTAFTTLSAGVTLSFRNKVINGNFAINQRVAVSGTSLASGAYFLDRWRSATSTNAVTWAVSGVGNLVTIPATEEIEQVIEGNNIEGGVYTLSWVGTATAQVNGVSIANGAQTSSLTAAANVTLKFLAGTVSLVQFEKATVATPFEQRHPSLEILLCQRYYEKNTPISVAYNALSLDSSDKGIAVTTSALLTYQKFLVEKRVAPTINVTNGGNGVAGQVRNSGTGTFVTLNASAPTTKCLGLTLGSAALFTAGNFYDYNWEAVAEL